MVVGTRLMATQECPIHDNLKNALAAGLTQAVPGLRVTVPGAGAPHILHLMVPDADGGALLTHLDQAGVACSTGSACSSGRVGPSHVLVAMGTDTAWSGSALRLSLASSSTQEDVDALLRVLTAALHGDA